LGRGSAWLPQSDADVLDSVAVAGANLVIDLGGGDSVTLVNYMQGHTIGSFAADDFLV
jgi:hypothetical protein